MYFRHLRTNPLPEAVPQRCRERVEDRRHFHFFVVPLQAAELQPTRWITRRTRYGKQRTLQVVPRSRPQARRPALIRVRTPAALRRDRKSRREASVLRYQLQPGGLVPR